MSRHLTPFALLPALPDSLAGRDSCDYYGVSVAIGLASRRRSHVRPRCTCRAELRWPTHLLEYPHWVSPAPRRLRQPMSDADAGHGTGPDVFPVDGGLHRWRLGFRQFSFHHIPRVPQHLTPVRLGTTAAFLACSGPLHLSDPGKPSDPRTSLRVLPGCAGDTTRRLVAHLNCRESRAVEGHGLPGAGRCPLVPRSVRSDTHEP
jgi:hypothetical protein